MRAEAFGRRPGGAPPVSASEIAAALARDDEFIDRLATALAAKMEGASPAPQTKPRKKQSQWTTADEGEHRQDVAALGDIWRDLAARKGQKVKFTPAMRKRAYQVLTDSTVGEAARSLSECQRVMEWGFTNGFFASQMVSGFPTVQRFRQMRVQANESPVRRGGAAASEAVSMNVMDGYEAQL